MTHFIQRAVLAMLLASAWNPAHAFTVELVATGQFEAEGGQVYRSLEPPVEFLISPSPFGRPVYVTIGPTSARLLDPDRVSRDSAEPEVVRVDMAGPQENFLSVRPEGEDLIISRESTTMTLKPSPPILGDRTLDEVMHALPEYRRGAARYSPNPATLDKLRRVTQRTELLVVFGSWCPHCEQAVPRLARVLQDVKGAPIGVTFHGVPPDGGRDAMMDELHVTRLPTGIVRRDGKELARMEGDAWDAPEKSLATLVTAPAR